jgi:diguanylate cyclase (GGDEF)-like protein
VSVAEPRRFGRVPAARALRKGGAPNGGESLSVGGPAGRGVRTRIVGALLALALALIALPLYGAFRSAASEADSKLLAQTTLQLARARVDLGSRLTRSSSQLYLSGKLLRPGAQGRAHVYLTQLGALQLVQRDGGYRLERELVVGGGASPLVRLHENLPVNAALLDRLGSPKVDPQALGVLSLRGVVIAGDRALLGRRLPTSGSVTVDGLRYSVASSPLDSAASLQVLVPAANVHAQLVSTQRKLLGGGAFVLLAVVASLYVLGRPFWRPLGEKVDGADDGTDDTPTDDLTGLASASMFRLALAFELERSKRYRAPFALVVIDLDGFKQIEDRYGRAAGDETLRSVADVITGTLPSDGFAARTGRDEFALLLPDTDLAGAAEVAERVRAGQDEAQIRYGRALFRVTASVGVAVSVAATVPQDLLQQADDALARAKQAGKNRVEPLPQRAAAGLES